MIEATLVILACLTSDPKHCKNVEIQTPWGQHGCSFSAQPLAARWAGENPRWRIARYRCEPGKPA